MVLIMKIYLSLLLIIIPSITFSQTKETELQLGDYQMNKVYEVRENSVIVSITFDKKKAKKDDLYEKVKSYLEENYSDHNSEMIIDDKSIGTLELKSVLFNFFEYRVNSTIPVTYHAFYKLRIDVLEDKLQITNSVNEWMVEWSTIGNNFKVEGGFITDYVPLGKKKIYGDGDKTADAFLALIDKMYASIDALEKSLTEGSIAGENDDW